MDISGVDELDFTDFMVPLIELPSQKSTPQDPMSPSAGENAQTPDPKATSGLASVFKSLTGSKSSKTVVQTPLPVVQKHNVSNGNPSALHGGAPDFEHFHKQLKPGNSLPDRISAAEALRYAVQDYPLEGVGDVGETEMH